MQEKKKTVDTRCLYILLFMSVCDCAIAIGGWTIYKWDGAGITIAAGVIGVIISVALCCWVVKDDSKQMPSPAPV